MQRRNWDAALGHWHYLMEAQPVYSKKELDPAVMVKQNWIGCHFYIVGLEDNVVFPIASFIATKQEFSSFCCSLKSSTVP